MFFILILILLYFFNDFINSFETQKKEENTPQQTQQQNINQVQPINQATQQSNNPNDKFIQNTEIEETNNLKLFKFNCFKNFCYYKQNNKDTLEIPMTFLIAITKDIDKSKKYQVFEKDRKIIYLLIDEQKLNFIQGVQNENDSKESNSFTGAVIQPN